MKKKNVISHIEKSILLISVGILVFASVALIFLNISEKNESQSTQALAETLTDVSVQNLSNYNNHSINRMVIIPVEITNCDQLDLLLPERALPNGYKLLSKSIDSGKTVECILVNGEHQTTFKAFGV